MKGLVIVAVIVIAVVVAACGQVEAAWTTLPNEDMQVMASGNETYPSNMIAILKDGELVWINGAGYGYKTSGSYEFIPIPPQDVSSMFQWVEVEDDPAMSHWEFIGVYEDLELYDPADLLPHSQHIGKLIAVDTGLAKPAMVRRWYEGDTYDIQCLVSQSVVDMWIADTLNVNDFVIVSFIEEIPNTTEIDIAVVVDKVYKSW